MEETHQWLQVDRAVVSMMGTAAEVEACKAVHDYDLQNQKPMPLAKALVSAYNQSVKLDEWLKQFGQVEFVELFHGDGGLTSAVRKAGFTAADGFSRQKNTYARVWQLQSQPDQADLAWLLVHVLKPTVVHMGTPCTNMCLPGRKQLDEATQNMNCLTGMILRHQESLGRYASVETPVGLSLIHI